MLLWSNVLDDRILRWSPAGAVQIFHQPSRHADGHTRDRQGT
ncbi:hypothetical protein V5738_05355 [Salinisphaera sp. SPP-AMP-43]